HEHKHRLFSAMTEADAQTLGITREPDVSVIVPAYNAERWITATLCSVLDQTLDATRYEIIVVDNESQDHTLEVAAATLEMCQARFTLSSEPQRGPAYARNHGLRLAHGSWIQFLDADDLLHREKLARQLAFAQACGSDVGLIYSKWQDLDQRGKMPWTNGSPLVPALDHTTTTTLVRSLISSAGFIPTGSQLFRRSALADVGGYRVGLVEDVDLYVRLATAGWCFAHCFSPEPLFIYRRHRGDGSLSKRSTVAFADGVVRNAALVES